MRSRKFIAFSVIGLGAAGLMAILVWPSHCPLHPRLVGLQPSGILGSDGIELWLVNVSMEAQGTAPLLFDPAMSRVEARINGHWLGTGEEFRLSSIFPGHPNETLFLLAKRADAFRLHLRYAYEGGGLDRSISDWLWHGFPSLYGTNWVGRQLTRWYYASRLRPSGPRHWQEVRTPQLLLQKQSAPTPHERRAHNPTRRRWPAIGFGGCH
jgi:hypothetical protein